MGGGAHAHACAGSPVLTRRVEPLAQWRCCHQEDRSQPTGQGRPPHTLWLLLGPGSSGMCLGPTAGWPWSSRPSLSAAYVLPLKVELELVIQQYEKAKVVQDEQLERLTQICQEQGVTVGTGVLCGLCRAEIRGGGGVCLEGPARPRFCALALGTHSALPPAPASRQLSPHLLGTVSLTQVKPGCWAAGPRHS